MLSEQFQLITGLDCEIISTLDHPYVSPPIRLLDSHKRLLALHKTQHVCILNWDVSQPNDRTYRYDLQIDLGFITRSKNLFLFNKNTPYALQTSNIIDFQLYDEILRAILDHALDQKKLTRDSVDNININYTKLRNNVLNDMKSNTGGLVADYTQTSLVNMYSLLSLPDMSNFIKNNYLYYFKSNLMNKWIPFCIENANGKRAIEIILKNNIFGRKIFRSTDELIDDEMFNDFSYLEMNKAKIANLIRNNKIIPSVEVLYWSLELAGKYHFGNDYGFFERYQEYLDESLNNQLTTMKNDGINYFQMKKDYGIAYDINLGKFTSRSASSQVKDTRINSMFAFYILLGDKMARNINNPKAIDIKKVEIVDGKIILT